MLIFDILFEEKIKGADGKACWDGYRYAGTEDGKDKCVPVKEDDYEQHSSRDAVQSAIINRIMRAHTDILGKYGPDKVLQAVENQADWVGEVDEIGSSDISIWVREVIKELEHAGQ
jgi:hypothetical protein